MAAVRILAVLAVLCLLAVIGALVVFGALAAARDGRGRGVRIRFQTAGPIGMIGLAVLSAVLAGWMRGGQVRSRLDGELSLALDGKSRTVEGRVIQVEDHREQLLLTLRDGRMEDGGIALGRLLVYVDNPEGGFGPSGSVLPGQMLRVRGEMEAFQTSRNPGEFDSRMYYRSRNCCYRMFAKSWEILDGRSSPLSSGLLKLRRVFQSVLDSSGGEPERGILSAALLGNKAELDEEVKALYQNHGIAHLLAISGLHISMIGMGAYKILRWGGMGYAASGIWAGAFIAAYGGMTGSGMSAVRAVLMLLCCFGAGYFGRTYDLLSAAALSAVLLLWDAPYLLFQGGFQLSFGAVAALGGLETQMKKLLNIRRGWQAALLGGSAVQCITCPVILYHFFSFPTYGFFLNLVVIPLMFFVLLSGILGMATGIFWPGMGTAALGASHYILLFYEALCRGAQRLPAWNLVLGRPPLGRIALYYGLLFLGVFLGTCRIRAGKRKLPWAVLPAFLLLCFLLLWPPPLKDLSVTFLDVGQGDGIVLETKNLSVLVDGGSSSEKELGAYRLEPFLKSRGIGALDYVLVSHGDADHINGISQLLARGNIPIKTLVLPWLGREEESQIRLAEAARERGGRVVFMKTGDELRSGKLVITCIYPGEEDPAKDRNEQSLVLHVEYGAFQMLLTGDMTKEGEKRILDQGDWDEKLGAVQVLKAAHHGSDTSSGEPWIKALHNLKWAVVSYGEGNSYGHPDPKVIGRLEQCRIRIWRTAQSGAVTMRTDGKRIWWDTWLHPDE